MESCEHCGADKKRTTLEQEFRNLCATVGKDIEAELALAEEHLNNAVALSNKSGLPFNAGISFLSQTYEPDGFAKFKELDEELLEELCGTLGNEYGGGWEHSAVC